jgi:nitroreductase
MKQESITAQQAVYLNILTRESIRQYEDRPVEKEKIEMLLRAGMAAPSGVDRRPWHLVVVTTPSRLSALSEASPNAKFVKNAPLAIVVCGDMDKALSGVDHDLWVQDCSAMTENILLTAHALGLGAVWTADYPHQDRCAAVRQALGLPEKLVPLDVIVIGYPKSMGNPKDKWNPDNVTYM